MFAIVEVIFFLFLFPCGMAVVCKGVFMLSLCVDSQVSNSTGVWRPERDTDFRILRQSLFQLDGLLKLRVSPAMLV